MIDITNYITNYLLDEINKRRTKLEAIYQKQAVSEKNCETTVEESVIDGFKTCVEALNLLDVYLVIEDNATMKVIRHRVADMLVSMEKELSKRII